MYNDITIAATKEYTDYIPQHIHQMENIVKETYRSTRGILWNNKSSEVYQIHFQLRNFKLNSRLIDKHIGI